jgi:hypothetical protein
VKKARFGELFCAQQGRTLESTMCSHLYHDCIPMRHADDPVAELNAHVGWIGERLSRSNYRGCPQINVAAEFAERDHPARQVARSHMQALRARLTAIAHRLNVARPGELAAQIAVLVNGAFVSSELLVPDEAAEILLASVRALLLLHAQRLR